MKPIIRKHGGVVAVRKILEKYGISVSLDTIYRWNHAKGCIKGRAIVALMEESEKDGIPVRSDDYKDDKKNT